MVYLDGRHDNIVIAALAFDDSTPYPGSAALLSVAGAVAIIAVGCAASSRLVAGALLGRRHFSGSAPGPTRGTSGIGQY